MRSWTLAAMHTKNFFRRTCTLLACLCFFLSACADSDPEPEPNVELRAGEAPSCVATDDPNQLRSEFLARLFPKSGDAQALFCALDPNAGACEIEATNLTGVIPFGGTPPTVATCKAASGPALATCDRFAKHLITRGLADGDLMALLRGVTRLRDVMLRPQVPAYYAPGAPNNPFTKWLVSAGIDATLLGDCTGGTAAEGYACLATNPKPSHRAITRGLLELLERHNGVIARTMGLAGTAERQAKIFASATGPMSAYLTETGDFAPTAGHGVQRVDALARHFALRVLDGTAGDEVAHYAELPSYRPPGQESNESLTAGLGVLAAQAATYAWNDASDAPWIHNGTLAADLENYFAILDATARTAAGLGRCMLAQDMREVRIDSARLNLIAVALQREFRGVELGVHNTLGMSVVNGVWNAQTNALIGECGMHQELVAVTLSYTTVVAVDAQWYSYTNDLDGVWECQAGDELVLDPSSGESHEILSCTCTGINYDPIGGGAGVCEDWDVEIDFYSEYEQWIQYGAILNAHGQETIGSTIVKDEVHAAYNDLIDSHRTAAYDVENDGRPDLSHRKAAGERVSILESSVEWTQCAAELEGVSQAYSQETITDIACSAGDGVDENCQEDDLTGLYVPYAVASRVCPEHVAKIVGVAADTTWIHECTTPWSFTRAVQYFLEHDAVTESMIEDYPEMGSEVKPLLADFAAEAIHLAQPAAAFRAHRADFASVAGNVAAASAGTDSETWYSQNVGFDVMEGHLDAGERIMGAGLELVADFEKTEVWGEAGRSILARLCGNAFETCSSSVCAENEKLHVRALFYRRLRDSIDTYRRLSHDHLEAQWRRLDAELCIDTDVRNGYNECNSCLRGHDQDGDGTNDTLICDAQVDLDLNGAADCAEQCGYFGTANRIVYDGVRRMDELASILDAHSTRAQLEPEQQEFVASAAAFASGVGEGLHARHQAMFDGIDWLGFRSGEWYPGLRVDLEEGLLEAADQFDAALAELEEGFAAADFDGFIDRYFANVSNLANWATEVEEGYDRVQDSVANLCGGGPGACDVDWGSDYDLVGRINAGIDAYVCTPRPMLIFYYVADVGPVPFPFIIEPDGDCPEPLQSPDFDALPATGTIPLAAAQMEVTLTELAVALEDIDAYIELIEKNNSDRVEIGQMLASLDAAERKRERLRDIITCAAAGLGAAATTVASAACTAGTAGGCTPLSATATATVWGAAIRTCGETQADAEWANKAPTREEFERAFQEYTMSLQVNSEEYTLASKVSALFTLFAHYNVDVTAYLTEVARLERTAAYGNTVLDNLITEPLRDPSFQLFDDDLAAMKGNFEDAAKLARDARSLMQYDIGQAVREGTVFETAETDAHYLPRLAEITSYGAYAQGSSAMNLLAVTGGRDQVGNPAEAYNLQSYASLLEHVHAEYTNLYEDRAATSAVWIGGSDSGMPVASGFMPNLGEMAMLGDSPFYDPAAAPSQSCDAGWVDLHDYCAVFDDGDAVPVGTCLDVETLTPGERYNLTYAAHLVRGVGVETFTCYRRVYECTAYDEDGICIDVVNERAPHIEVAAGGDFTLAALLGTCPDCDHTDSAFYDAQTPEVRNIIDRFRSDQAARPYTLANDALAAQPGTFLWLVNMAPDRERQGHASTTFDIEADLLDNAPSAVNTLAEHLTSVVLVCTEDEACAGSSTPMTDFLFLGDGVLGSRCQEVDTGRQERVRFRMDADVEKDLVALKHLEPATLEAAVTAKLEDPGLLDRMNGQPLQGGSWIVALHAYAHPNGGPVSEPWSLARGGSDDGPRVRIAVRYSFYEGYPQSGDYEYSVAGLLECHGGSDDTLCVPPMCP